MYVPPQSAAYALAAVSVGKIPPTHTPQHALLQSSGVEVIQVLSEPVHVESATRQMLRSLARQLLPQHSGHALHHHIVKHEIRVPLASQAYGSPHLQQLADHLAGSAVLLRLAVSA